MHSSSRAVIKSDCASIYALSTTSSVSARLQSLETHGTVEHCDAIDLFFLNFTLDPVDGAGELHPSRFDQICCRSVAFAD